ncbi:MAG: symmetrical bis(5'-nucleosyl)-tetraphosphatase, partial [Thiotrichales bacterium]|nr:symmetrical bis(5'-nucleosyl)-tetraphosphatase [Thiotrichales bacterium]MBT4654108.1 symmetrical bis(5'-nucleosyl)-tetraphosphatase [Thiotrichales bacterium]
KNVDTKNIYPLDHGCVWDGHLSAYNLTNQNCISLKSVET